MAASNFVGAHVNDKLVSGIILLNCAPRLPIFFHGPLQREVVLASSVPFAPHVAAAHLFVKPVTYTVSKFFASTRPAGCSAGRPGGRPGGTRVVSGAEKKII